MANKSQERSQLSALLVEGETLPVRVLASGQLQLTVTSPGGEKTKALLQHGKVYDLLTIAPITWWRTKPSKAELLRAVDNNWIVVVEDYLAAQAATVEIATPEDTHHRVLWRSGTVPTKSGKGTARMYFDGDKLLLSENGRPYAPVGSTVRTATTETRSALPSVNEGDLVFVEDSSITWQYIGGDVNLDTSWYFVGQVPLASFFDSEQLVHLYVDATAGSDNNDGYSSAKPKKTIQAAMSAIPNGLLAYEVRINLAPGVYPESEIVFTPVPGGGPWGSLIRIVCAVDVVAALETDFVQTPVTDSDGVVKTAQTTIECTPWGTPILNDGRHFIRCQNAFDIQGVVPLAARSDETTGTLGVVFPTSSVFGSLTNISTHGFDLVTLACTFPNLWRVNNASGIPAWLSFADLTYTAVPTVSGVSLSGCRLRDTLIKGDTTQRYVFGCQNITGHIHFSSCENLLVSECRFAGHSVCVQNSTLRRLIGCVLAGDYSRRLHIGGNSPTTTGGDWSGPAGITEMYNCDFEGSSNRVAILISGGYVNQRTGNISFNNTTIPIHVAVGGRYVRRGGLLTGRASQPVTLATGGQAEGLGAAHTLVNTANATQQVKVGANAAIEFSGIGVGKNDFAVGDTSQGCRTT